MFLRINITSFRIYPKYNRKLYCGCAYSQENLANTNICISCMGLHESDSSYNPQINSYITDVLTHFQSPSSTISFQLRQYSSPRTNRCAYVETNNFLNILYRTNVNTIVNCSISLSERLATQVIIGNKLYLNYNSCGVPFWRVSTEGFFTSISELRWFIRSFLREFIIATNLDCEYQVDLSLVLPQDVVFNLVNISSKQQLYAGLRNFRSEIGYLIKRNYNINAYSYVFRNKRLLKIERQMPSNYILPLVHHRFPDQQFNVTSTTTLSRGFFEYFNRLGLTEANFERIFNSNRIIREIFLTVTRMNLPVFNINLFVNILTSSIIQDREEFIERILPLISASF